MWFSMEHITCWLVLSSPKNLRQKKTWIIILLGLNMLEHICPTTRDHNGLQGKLQPKLFTLKEISFMDPSPGLDHCI